MHLDMFVAFTCQHAFGLSPLNCLFVKTAETAPFDIKAGVPVLGKSLLVFNAQGVTQVFGFTFVITRLRVRQGCDEIIPPGCLSGFAEIWRGECTGASKEVAVID